MRWLFAFGESPYFWEHLGPQLVPYSFTTTCMTQHNPKMSTLIVKVSSLWYFMFPLLCKIGTLYHYIRGFFHVFLFVGQVARGCENIVVVWLIAKRICAMYAWLKCNSKSVNWAKSFEILKVTLGSYPNMFAYKRLQVHKDV